MKVVNFKGVRTLEVDLGEKGAIISGANEQGKSTVYDAYLWCLFGATTRQNDCVQPIGEDNQIVHKIETKVEITLSVDGTEVKLARVLSEKWKAQDTAEEKFVSAEQKRFYNDVPCGVREFEDKLNAIFPVNNWLMLSNIRTFMEQRMESRRDLLNKISSGFDEAEAAKPYLLVAQALAQGKTIVEFEKQVKDTKKRAENEIKSIPQQIAAQDKLRVDADFEKLHADKLELDAQIADIDKQLQASPEELEAERSRKEKLAKAENVYNALRTKWQDGHFKRMQELEVARLKAQENLTAEKNEQAQAEARNKTNKQKLATLAQDFDEKKQEWLQKNNEEFTYTPMDICPCCGHRLTDEEKQAMRNTAVNEFNKKKADILAGLLNECSELKERMRAVGKAIAGYENSLQAEDARIIVNLQSELEKAMEAKNEESRRSIDDDSEIAAAKGLVQSLSAAPEQFKETTADEGMKAQRDALKTQRDAILARLAGEQTNVAIDKEKERLNAEAKKQAQTVADCDNALSQIRKFKKDIIDRTEESINKYFRMVNWKFVEQNKTNDDEKQLCTPLYKGIEYNRQNYASQVNMGVDICEGIMRGFDVQLPLWVDNTESVCKLLDTDTQVILLRVVPDQKLAISSL